MRRAARTAPRALIALVTAMLALGACGRGSTPPAGPAPGAPAPPVASAASADEVRALLLRSLFGSAARPPATSGAAAVYDATAIPLRYPGRDLWLAVTSGSRVFETPGDRKQVAAIYERRGDGWSEIARRTLESAPTTITAHQLTAPELTAPRPAAAAWVAVAGSTAARGGTYEVLRFDGTALRSALWWFSPLPQAAHEVDLDGDGVVEVVLDASDPEVLCAGCGVLDISEVIYRWVGGELTPVQLAPLASGPAALPVARAIVLANGGLWSEAAQSMAAARQAAPSSDEVRWMALLIGNVAAARLAQAGAAAQPLLTQVLAGEYASATALMRRLDPAEAFAPDGPLIAKTAAAPAPATKAMGAALVDAATRALARKPELADAYLVRALGRLLVDPRDFAGALADANRAVTAAPNDAFARASVTFLTARSARR